tara:strand:- start:95 stop:466 length:372 start_codon:yes stop_codon:yes gene_type:complete
MSSRSDDRFTREVLGRLDGIEPNSRIDRDARHGLAAFGFVVLVVVAMLISDLLFEGATPGADDRDSEASALISPGSILEAVDRIRVPTTTKTEIGSDPSGSMETGSTPGRYERIDATAPGSRT